MTETDVVWAYSKTLAVILVNLLVAHAAAPYLVRRMEPILPLLTLLGSILLLVAGIGRLGWSIQTIDGTSAPERLNDSLFWLFSQLGAFAIFLEWSLRWRAAKSQPASRS